MTRPLVLGTAGHVDHGKTALVLALTGHDTDRLAEEKRRGISIELGFAPLDLPSGERVSLVDVPGHERFVRHMVAGTTGVDGFLLCVAADDGVMPQTREHLSVLSLLGIEAGVVAITRSDRADPTAATREVATIVGADVEAVAVCAPTGEGIPELLAALDRLVTCLRPRIRSARPRLFVDRSFSIAGAGTVVTGTLWGGELDRGARVVVHPGAAEGMVRGIQVHDSPVERASGGRTALNLSGLSRDKVPRGSCVTLAADGWEPSDRLGVALTWLPDAGGSFRSGGQLHCLLGTSAGSATCLLLDRNRIDPGETGLAELRFTQPVCAEVGDRLILRSAEPLTVGGAQVLDTAPPRGGRRAERRDRLAILRAGAPDEILRLHLREAGPRGLAVTQPGAGVLLAGRVFDADVVEAARAAAAAVTTVAAARAATGLPPAAAAVLVDELIGEGAFAKADSADPAIEALADLLETAGLRPPTPSELGVAARLAPKDLRIALAKLRDTGRVILAADDLWFSCAALADATTTGRAALAEAPKGIAELRDLWGVGRKHALAIAAYLDATGITVRQGEVRILRDPNPTPD